MKKILLAALALALAGLATACRKEDDVTCFDAGPASLETFTKRYSPKVQEFTLNATAGGTVRTIGGTTLTLSPQVLILPNGDLVQGNVTLSAQEIAVPSEMFLADLHSTTLYFSDGGGLESGGQFNIKIRQQNQLLRLRADRRAWSGLQVTTPVPARVSPENKYRMTTWYRLGVLSDTSCYGWAPVQADTMGVKVLTDSTTLPNKEFYQAFYTSDSLGWLNIDVIPYTTAPRVVVEVNAGQDLRTLPPHSYRVYLIPANLNGAFRLGYNYQTGNAWLHQTPAGLDLTAVVLRVKDGKYFFGTHRAPAADGFVYQPQLEEMSEQELVRRLRLL